MTPQSGGVAGLNHRLQAGTPSGVRICGGRESGGVAGRWGNWFWVGGGIPAVSLVPSSTAGYRLSSRRDEVGEGERGERCGEMVAGVDGGDRADRTDLARWGEMGIEGRGERGRGRVRSVAWPAFVGGEVERGWGRASGAIGEGYLDWGRDSGGVARAELNRRLQAFIPAG
jgi:hypothetical protein